MTVRKADSDSFLKSDRAILMTCISIALVFWLLVKLSQSFDTLHEVQINYELPEGKAFALVPPSKVEATLSGRGWDLLSYFFGKKQSEILLKLSNLENQTFSASQLKDRIRSGVSSIDVINLDYDYISIKIENQAIKKIPIRLDKQVTFAEGIQLKGSPILQPDSLTLSGPSSAVSTLTEWFTQPLVLTDLKSDYSAALKLRAPLQEGPISIKPLEINVAIEIEQYTERSLFVPVSILNAPDSLKIFPQNIRVNCVVGLSQYNELSDSLFSLEADLKGIPLNTKNNTVPIQLTRSPDFVKNIHFSPHSVEFFIVKE